MSLFLQYCTAQEDFSAKSVYNNINLNRKKISIKLFGYLNWNRSTCKLILIHYSHEMNLLVSLKGHTLY